MTEDKPTQVIGVYGGTFDPVHNGHIQPVKEAAQSVGIQNISLIPCHIPPHKGIPSATPEQRMEMLKLVCNEHPCFSIDECELEKSTPSYTVETLKEIRKRTPRIICCPIQ